MRKLSAAAPERNDLLAAAQPVEAAERGPSALAGGERRGDVCPAGTDVPAICRREDRQRGRNRARGRGHCKEGAAMKILVINGPNLNLLGLREPAIYGSQSYAALLEKIQAFCDKEGVEVSFFQSNHEGAIVDEIQAAYGVYDGIVINPAAYTHTSVAILDALKAVAIPAVEVHISDGEPFRQVSYAGMACVKTYKGLGFDGYIEAVRFLEDYLA